MLQPAEELEVLVPSQKVLAIIVANLVSKKKGTSASKGTVAPGMLPCLCHLMLEAGSLPC